MALLQKWEMMAVRESDFDRAHKRTEWTLESGMARAIQKAK